MLKRIELKTKKINEEKQKFEEDRRSSQSGILKERLLKTVESVK